MEPQPNFNIEDYLDEIVEEVKKRQEKNESQDANYGPENQRQVIYEMMGKKLGKSQMNQSIPSKVVPPKHNDKSYDNFELKSKVDSLIDLVFERDLDTAIDKAKAQNNPALLDAFHDALTDKIHEQLIESGKLSPI